MQAWTKRAYAMGTKFRVVHHDVDGIRSLGALIEHIKSDPTAFIIRGELVETSRWALDPTKSAAVFRRYKAKPGQPPPRFYRRLTSVALLRF
jgi:hypothetical protein